MTMETAFRARLLDDSTISAIAGNFIDWVIRPQKSPFPSVVLQVRNDDHSQHMAGFDTFHQATIQASCFSLDYKQASELRQAIINVASQAAIKDGVEFLRGFIGLVVDRGQNTDTGFVHQCLVDLIIWHDA